LQPSHPTPLPLRSSVSRERGDDDADPQTASERRLDGSSRPTAIGKAYHDTAVLTRYEFGSRAE
jgi:hypothetical protein